jgi:predicted permease
VLKRNLHVPHQERLAVVHIGGKIPGHTSRDNSESVFSSPVFRRLQESPIPGLLALIARSGFTGELTDGEKKTPVRIEVVSGNYFQELGLTPFAGRLLTTSDDSEGKFVAVISHSYWVHEGRLPILGHSVLLNGRPVTVVGVTPSDFRGMIPGLSPDLYVPLAMYPVADPGAEPAALTDPKWQFLNVLAFPASRKDASQALAALNARFDPILREEFASRGTRIDPARVLPSLSFHPAAEAMNILEQTWAQPLVIMFGTSLGLLLISCLSLGSLFLARSSQCETGQAIRQGLGASRWQVLREWWIESALLSLFGGVTAVGVCSGVSSVLLLLVPDGTGGGWVRSAPALQLSALCVPVAFLIAFAASSVPGLRLPNDMTATLRGQGRSVVTVAGEGRVRRALVSLQIAVSAALVVVAGLFASSLANLLAHDPGFQIRPLITFRLEPALAGYNNTNGIALYGRIHERLESLPGVSSVSYSESGLFGHYTRSTSVTVDGYHPGAHENTSCIAGLVGPGYFATLGVPLDQGRDILASDTLTSRRIAVVNRAFLRRFIASRNPIGVTFRIPGEPAEVAIVGVVRDLQESSIREDARPAYYLPLAQAAVPDRAALRAHFVVRVSGDSRQMLASVGSLARGVDGSVSVSVPREVPSLLAGSSFEESALCALTVAAAFLALMLAGIGLYGVMSFEMSRRTAEIGIRTALGASWTDILKLGMMDVAAMLGGGCALGLAAAVALGRTLSSQLFGVKPVDASVYAVAITVLGAVAVCSAAVPLFRALRISPVEALRNQ